MAVHPVRLTALGNVVTRQDLYNLFGLSTLSGMNYDALSTSGKAGAIRVGSLPPADLSQGTWWYDQTDQLMRVFDSTSSYAYACGPDRFEIGGRISSTEDAGVKRGWGVKLDPYRTWTGRRVYIQPCSGDPFDWLHCMGIASVDADPGDNFPVTIEGIVPAYFVGDYKGSYPIPPALVVGATGYTGCFQAVAQTHTDLPTLTVLGIVAENPRYYSDSAASFCCYIKFFGPRWMPRAVV